MPQISQGDESMNIDDFLLHAGSAPPNVSGLDVVPEAHGLNSEIDGVRLAADVAGQIADSAADAATSNPALSAVLVVIGLAFVAGTIWGLIKGAIKLALALGIIAAVIWFFVLGR